jgi:hypothetical protein
MQPHGQAVLTERLQVQRRAHVPVTATDCLLDLGHRHPDFWLSARKAPQRFKDVDQVSSTHAPIVADPPESDEPGCSTALALRRDRRPRANDESALTRAGSRLRSELLKWSSCCFLLPSPWASSCYWSA